MTNVNWKPLNSDVPKEEFLSQMRLMSAVELRSRLNVQPRNFALWGEQFDENSALIDHFIDEICLLILNNCDIARATLNADYRRERYYLREVEALEMALGLKFPDIVAACLLWHQMRNPAIFKNSGLAKKALTLQSTAEVGKSIFMNKACSLTRRDLRLWNRMLPEIRMAS